MIILRRKFIEFVGAIGLGVAIPARARPIAFEVIHNADFNRCGGIAVFAVSHPELGELNWLRHFRLANGRIPEKDTPVLCGDCGRPFDVANSEFRPVERKTA